MNMQSMADVVVDLNDLIAKYGLGVVKHALNYIDSFPAKPVIQKQYMFKNFSGADWFLSKEEFDKVNTAFNYGNGKIMAIKTFREITSCGLKEAKDAVEWYYGLKSW